MKAIDLNNNEFSWNLGKYYGKKNTNPSKLHVRVRDFLTDLYAATPVLEEVMIVDKLRFDFFLPSLKIAIECQSSIHSVYTPFFHGIHKSSFIKSKVRDNNKATFCELNNIKLIYFYEDESNLDWENKINGK